MKRQELLVRFQQHRDNADDLLRQADVRPPGGTASSTNLAARAQAHATLALVYLTDLLADDG